MSLTPKSSSSVTSGNRFKDEVPRVDHSKLRHVREELSNHATRDILLFLIAFRLLNALTIATFFQPDEYFQSLEPAWQMAFGKDSGAWITWEWKHQLRSSIHPALFAAVYKLANLLSQALHLSPKFHSELLIACPKILQAMFAALGDYSTWTLSQRAYGKGSKGSWVTLALTVINPWNWFCSTRTLSNCLETTLTIAALNRWPWQWSLDDDGGGREGREGGGHVDEDGLRTTSMRPALGGGGGQVDVLTDLRRCLLLAALACVLRPTNILIWGCLTILTLFRAPTKDRPVPPQRPASHRQSMISNVRLFSATPRERYILMREVLLCGTLVLVLSALVDRAYYRQWTLPPYRFLYFNLAQSLAVFYGRNDWHYYFSQGFPLLLTTLLPFAATGLWQSIQSSPASSSLTTTERLSCSILRTLGLTSLFVPLPLSLISHKEVRFIYPLLPLLHILSARPFSTFFAPDPYRFLPRSLFRHALLSLFLASSLAIAVFTTRYHQPAPLHVLSYLRNKHISKYLTQPPLTAHLTQADSTMTVGFLMPCHSTPWRSHLVFPSIKAWALSCEPPVNLNASAKANYLDEADVFYLDPRKFLEKRLAEVPRGKNMTRGGTKTRGSGMQGDEMQAWDGRAGEKMWPDYVVFFEALEPVLQEHLRDTAYGPCWRGWNSFFHDDRRRRGDVVVWCLEGRRGTED